MIKTKINLLVCLLITSCSFTPGGGASEQYAPDTTKTDEPTLIKLIVSAWGAGGPIKGRYTNISLHYRLTSGDIYKSVQPKVADLPDNYKKVASKTNQFEAYEFTILAYPEGTTGEIEYYFEMKFDRHQNRVNGTKNIKIT
ncbi:MAG: hypothetical protein AABX33_01735 [Nanoarchaeota archaeon]